MKWEHLRLVVGKLLFCCLLVFATGITFLFSYPFLGLAEDYKKMISEGFFDLILGRLSVFCISIVINGAILSLIHAVFKLVPLKKYAIILGFFIVLGLLARSIDFFINLSNVK